MGMKVPRLGAGPRSRGQETIAQETSLSRNIRLFLGCVATGWCNVFFFNLVMSLCDDLE
jgi:hypothetical protein